MTARRWMLACALLGLAIVWVGQHRSTGAACAQCRPSSAPAAQPPPGDSPSTRPDESVLAPKPADPAALSRLFRFRMTCERMAGIAREQERLSKDPDSWINNADTAKALSPEALKSWQDALAEWQSNREACARLGTSVGDGSIYEVALRAANAGDGDAASCYIMTMWPMPKDPQFKGQAVGHTQMGVLPSFISDYNRNARRLLEEGKTRGDWRMVTLANVVFNDRHGQLIGGLRASAAPDEEYVSLKLMLLGSRGQQAAQLSRQVEFALQQVPANRVVAADARAQDLYDRYFANKGEYQWGFGACR